MLENKFQSQLIKKIKDLLPDCIILKNDPSYIQGMPDLTILFKDRWAMLECKKSKKANHQPNQDYYVNKTNSMSFASFIYPEIADEVLNKLIKFLKK